jgi:hypothetical protein
MKCFEECVELIGDVNKHNLGVAIRVKEMILQEFLRAQEKESIIDEHL